MGVKRNLPRWRVLSTGQAVGCNSNAGLYQLNRSFPRARPLTSHALTIKAGNGLDPRPNVEHEPSAFPNAVVVDYIRYYRRVPCLGNLDLESPNEHLSSFGEYNFVTGTTVSLSNAFTLSTGQQLEIVARDAIVFGPGTLLDPNTDFVGRIGSSNCGEPPGIQGGAALMAAAVDAHDDLSSEEFNLAQNGLGAPSDLVMPNALKVQSEPWDQIMRFTWMPIAPALNAQVRISDVLGREISSSVLPWGATEHSIETTNWPSGVYVVSARIGAAFLSTRFVIEH